MGGDAGAIGDVAHGDGRYVAIERDGADAIFGLHLDLLADHGSCRAIGEERGRDHDRNFVEQAELDGAWVHHARALRGCFEHFFGGDVKQPARVGLDARVGAEDALDIGVDLDLLGAEGCSEATAEESEPPRPSVVKSSASLAPWKPAMITTLPAANSRSIDRC